MNFAVIAETIKPKMRIFPLELSYMKSYMTCPIVLYIQEFSHLNYTCVLFSFQYRIILFSFSGEHIHPYCNRIKQRGLQTECTEQRDAVALCNLVEYQSNLPHQYQHFYRYQSSH